MGVYQYQPMSGSLVPIDGSAKDMQGASASAAGTHGLVPQPSAGDENKVLKGDGTWGEASNNFVGTMDEWNALSLSEKILYETADIESEEPIQTYTITYNANGGSGSMSVDIKNQDESYTIKTDEFDSPVNTVFMRWNTSADGTGIDYFEGVTYTDNANLTLYAIWDYALKFSSDESFTLRVYNKQWNGTLEYLSDNQTIWSVWDGSQISGTKSQPIFIRGRNNTTITNGTNSSNSWYFTGKYCTGNIENLLDYTKVRNNESITRDNYCYGFMFYNCSSLITPPQLSSMITTGWCYYGMFQNCTALNTLPNLPAQNITGNYCYMKMFEGCSNIRLSTTQTDIYQYEYRIPTEGTGTNDDNSQFDGMFEDTGGTFIGRPTINTIYYTDHEPV